MLTYPLPCWQANFPPFTFNFRTCPYKIFSGLIQPIPYAFPMDEGGKPARHGKLRQLRAQAREFLKSNIVHRRHFAAYGSAISRVAR